MPKKRGRAAVEARTNMAVLHVVCFPSMQRRAVGIIRSSRREPGTTHGFDSGDADARWLPAVREWHSLRRALDRVFESLRSQPSHQVGGTSAIGAVFAK